MQTLAAFKWSTPAPALDGSPIAPWRVSDAHAVRAWLDTSGRPDAVAYVEHDGGGLWVGIRDNRDPVAHSAALVVLGDELRAAGARVKAVTRKDQGGRVVGLHLRDTMPKGARLTLV